MAMSWTHINNEEEEDLVMVVGVSSCRDFISSMVLAVSLVSLTSEDTHSAACFKEKGPLLYC